MRIVSRPTLQKCIRRHADARNAFLDWIDGVERAEWSSPADLQAGRWNPSILPGNRAVFRIRGNRYRIIAEINYKNQLVLIRFAGSHAEYDRVDAETV